MPWPQHIIDSFRKVNPDTDMENRWYGPYNVLLTTYFPPAEKWEVAPQYLQPEDRHMADYIVMYVVKLQEHPVFIVEIKSLPKLASVARRNSADKQVRS